MRSEVSEGICCMFKSSGVGISIPCRVNCVLKGWLFPRKKQEKNV